MRSLILTSLATLIVPASAQAAASACDINGDATVNILDTVRMIQVVQGAACPRYSCDIDADGDVDVLDLRRVHNHVLGVAACSDLEDALDEIPAAFGDDELALATLDLDADGEADMVVGLDTLAVSDMTSDLIYRYGVAFDLDGDDAYDLQAPIASLAIDPDGYEGDGGIGSSWFGFVPDAFTYKGSTWELALAAQVDSFFDVYEDGSRCSFVLDLDGDRIPDQGFSWTHVVGELF